MTARSHAGVPGTICAGLNEVPGFRCPIPGGAFYAFPNITGTGMDSKELADYLLYEAGVSCLGTQVPVTLPPRRIVALSQSD